MKIGIITKTGKNYGAVLQAFALKRKLCNMGHEAHIIKFISKSSKNSYKVCKYKWGLNGSKANIKAATHFLQYKRGTERFYNFRNEYFDFLGEYSNDKEIESNPPKCDIYISGSDQVWNPKISFDRSFYCCFAEKYPDSVKAAYAASIGLSEIPQEFYSEFKSRVKKFDYISVREKQAVSILEKMGINSQTAPDPTFLLGKEEWSSFSEHTVKEPYILTYFVSYPKGIEKTVKRFQEQLGLNVVNLMTSEESSGVGDIKIRNAGPKEFLGLFENASFVITSSFHGTAFSLINKKPFVATLYKSTSSRVTELLDYFDLSDRIIGPSNENISPYCNLNVFGESHDLKLKALREDGSRILKSILEVR